MLSWTTRVCTLTLLLVSVIASVTWAQQGPDTFGVGCLDEQENANDPDFPQQPYLQLLNILEGWQEFFAHRGEGITIAIIESGRAEFAHSPASLRTHQDVFCGGPGIAEI